MNNKININPSSTKWLEKDDRVVADYFCDLGFRSLKQILDMRVFDLMNMQGLNAVRVEEVIICLYKWLNPNTAIDEAIYNGMMLQPFHYSICTKISQESVLRREAAGNRRNFANVMYVEEGQDSRSRSLCRPCAHAVGNSTEGIGVQFYGVFEREEQSDDI